MKKEKKNKKKEVLEKIDTKILEIGVGEVLNITADEDNPVSDGLEYKDGGKDE